MDNDCDSSSRARGVSKAPILTGNYNISWDPMLSVSSYKKCSQGQKTDFSSSPQHSKSSTTSRASYFQIKKSDHYYGDLDPNHIPTPISYHKPPYSYEKRPLLAEAAPIPNRTSSLAFRSPSKDLKTIGSSQQSMPSSLEIPELSPSLGFGGKHLEHLQKVLEDIRTWHKEVSVSISRSHPIAPKTCHQNNGNIFPSQISSKQTQRLGSASMDSLPQSTSWAQVFNGGRTTSRRYTSRSLCPESNISRIWKIDPIPSSIYKSKPITNCGIRRSPRPIPSPRTSSLGATMRPRRRNAIRGRILPKRVSIVCPTLKQHSYQAQLTGSSPDTSVLGDYICRQWDGESTWANKGENTKIDSTQFPAVLPEHSNPFTNLQKQSCEDSNCQTHENGLPHSGTVIRLSARHSSLQNSEPMLETASLHDFEEEEEKARRHIAFVHSALRNLVPFEVSDYLYRVSQSTETSDDSEDTFLAGFSNTTPPYIRSNSTCQSSETLGQDECYNPGRNFSSREVSDIRLLLQTPDTVDAMEIWAPGTAI